MQRYYALVNKDEGSAFGVSFPDLPAVFSAADDEKDIVVRAMKALQLYFEDIHGRPEASSIEALYSREDVREELAQGGFLVSIPLIENNTEVVRADVTFEQELLKAVDEAAKARGLTRSAFLAIAARHET